MEPEIHRAVAEAAAARGESMNDFVVSALVSATGGTGDDLRPRGRVAERKARYEPAKKKPAPRRKGTGR